MPKKRDEKKITLYDKLKEAKQHKRGEVIAISLLLSFTIFLIIVTYDFNTIGSILFIAFFSIGIGIGLKELIKANKECKQLEQKLRRMLR